MLNRFLNKVKFKVDKNFPDDQLYKKSLTIDDNFIQTLFLK